MISRRTLINLGVFMGLAVVLIVFGIFNLVGSPFSHPVDVSATVPNAAGLHPNFDVTYNGVTVGHVRSVQLLPGGNGAHIGVSLDPGQKVPDNVVFTINLENALGEQEVELTPGKGPAPPLKTGDKLAVDPNQVPASIGELVSVADRLLSAIPPGTLNNLLHTMAVALQGRAQDLQTLNTAGLEFSQKFLAYQSQFQALLANSVPVLNAVNAVGPQLRDALENTAVLSEVLAQDRNQVANGLQQGAVAASDFQTFLNDNLANMACLTHDFADLNANLNQPANLSALDYGLKNNQAFFGAIDSVSPAGQAKSLYAGDPGNPNQPWLRVRLLVPPGQPQPGPYPKPATLPATQPGAACQTEFGNGVGPASQANPPAPGPGGSVSQPTAAQARVRGGGDPPGTAPAAYHRPLPTHDAAPATGPAILTVAGLTVVAGLGAAGRARTRRPAGARMPG
ncbi:MAG TPA: MCE family protein [Acidimicrobiales bacterium]|nr:MCE family protein [Acidimicrobiales bacterium]